MQHIGHRIIIDEAAKWVTLHGTFISGYKPILYCHIALRLAIRQRFASRFDTQWADVAMGRDFFSFMTHFTRFVAWTEELHCCKVASVAQFLIGH